MAGNFAELPPLTPDPIMAAVAGAPEYMAEHPNGVDTTVGVLLDPRTGKPWRAQSVRQAVGAAQLAVETADRFGYQTPKGHPGFLEQTEGLLLSGEADTIAPELLSYQTLGGTHALSTASEVLQQLTPGGTRRSLAYDAGWPNYPAIFGRDFDAKTYPHIDPSTGDYNHQGAMETFASLENGSVLVLQVGGYNDDGLGRTDAQWKEIFDLAQQKELTVVLDTAYLGLADGLEADSYPVREAISRGLFTIACLSMSKIMGMYSDRLGSMHIANADQHLSGEQVGRLNQHTTSIIRRTVSNAPFIPPEAARQALDPAILGEQYRRELEESRLSLMRTRAALAEIVGDRVPSVERGRGLFTKILSDGWSLTQIAFLKDHDVYPLPSSRVNVGGVPLGRVEQVGAAILGALDLSRA